MQWMWSLSDISSVPYCAIIDHSVRITFHQWSLTWCVSCNSELISKAIWVIMNKEVKMLEKVVIDCVELYPGNNIRGLRKLGNWDGWFACRDSNQLLWGQIQVKQGANLELLTIVRNNLERICYKEVIYFKILIWHLKYHEPNSDSEKRGECS
jgi:hypothetical protein